jgi:hypothetical protein
MDDPQFPEKDKKSPLLAGSSGSILYSVTIPAPMEVVKIKS